VQWRRSVYYSVWSLYRTYLWVTLEKKLRSSASDVFVTLLTRFPNVWFVYQVECQIPHGLLPGQEFHVQANGQTVAVTVPLGTAPGQTIRVALPAAEPQVWNIFLKFLCIQIGTTSSEY
jgi:hypothetical protein